MNLAHYSCQKRFDILNNVPFPYITHSQHKNAYNSEYSSCKLAPITSQREFISGSLPSINQLLVVDTYNHKSINCPSSPAESNFSSSSSPMLSSGSDCHTNQATSSDRLNTSHTIDYGNKLRLHVSKRTYINEDQTKILTDFYRSNKYPTHSEKVKLSKQLSLTERTIQIWFQNKRQNRGRKCKLN